MAAREEITEDVDEIDNVTLTKDDIKIVQKDGKDFELGRGNFGWTVLADARKTIGSKVIRKKVILKIQFVDDPNHRQLVEAEVANMPSFNHPYLVRKYGSYNDVREGRPVVVIIMRLCKGRDFNNFLRRVYRGEKEALGELTALKLFLQLVLGIGSLHVSNLVHRDVKPENILIDGDNLLLGDFGLSTRLLAQRPYLSRMAGTRMYAAPEQLRPGAVYSTPVDMWNAGLVLLEMLCVRRSPNPVEKWSSADALVDFFGCPMIPGELFTVAPQYCLHRIAELEVSAATKALLYGLLERNPARRLTFEGVLRSDAMHMAAQGPLGIKFTQMSFSLLQPMTSTLPFIETAMDAVAVDVKAVIAAMCNAKGWSYTLSAEKVEFQIDAIAAIASCQEDRLELTLRTMLNGTPAAMADVDAYMNSANRKNPMLPALQRANGSVMLTSTYDVDRAAGGFSIVADIETFTEVMVDVARAHFPTIAAIAAVDDAPALGPAPGPAPAPARVPTPPRNVSAASAATVAAFAVAPQREQIPTDGLGKMVQDALVERGIRGRWEGDLVSFEAGGQSMKGIVSRGIVRWRGYIQGNRATLARFLGDVNRALGTTVGYVSDRDSEQRGMFQISLGASRQTSGNVKTALGALLAVMTAYQAIDQMLTRDVSAAVSSFTANSNVMSMAPMIAILQSA